MKKIEYLLEILRKKTRERLFCMSLSYVPALGILVLFFEGVRGSNLLGDKLTSRRIFFRFVASFVGTLSYVLLFTGTPEALASPGLSTYAFMLTATDHALHHESDLMILLKGKKMATLLHRVAGNITAHPRIGKLFG